MQYQSHAAFKYFTAGPFPLCEAQSIQDHRGSIKKRPDEGEHLRFPGAQEKTTNQDQVQIMELLSPRCT